MIHEYIISYSVNGSPFVITTNTLANAEKHYDLIGQNDTKNVKTDYKHIIEVTKTFKTIK